MVSEQTQPALLCLWGAVGKSHSWLGPIHSGLTLQGEPRFTRLLVPDGWFVRGHPCGLNPTGVF